MSSLRSLRTDEKRINMSVAELATRTWRRQQLPVEWVAEPQEIGGCYCYQVSDFYFSSSYVPSTVPLEYLTLAFQYPVVLTQTERTCTEGVSTLQLGDVTAAQIKASLINNGSEAITTSVALT